jgi:TPR repeat protein
MKVCSLPLRTFYLLSMVFALIFRFVAAAEIPTAHQQALRNYQFYNNLAAESESKGDWNKALKAYEQALWNAQSASLSPEIQSDLNQKIERLRNPAHTNLIQNVVSNVPPEFQPFSRTQTNDLETANQLFSRAYQYEKSKSMTEAARYYRTAAEKGHTEAQNSLGSLYQFGEGVPQDYAQARSWYEKAEASGHATAICNLGYLYATGLGVSTNLDQAKKLFIRSAEKGHAQPLRIRHIPF